MNTFRTLRKYGPRLGAGVATLSASALAMAQDAAFTTAVADISADIAAYGAALVGVAAIAVVFLVAGKYVKKITRMA